MILFKCSNAASQSTLQIVSDEQRILMCIKLSAITCHAFILQEMLQIVKAVTGEVLVHIIRNTAGRRAATLSSCFRGLVDRFHLGGVVSLNILLNVKRLDD